MIIPNFNAPTPQSSSITMIFDLVFATKAADKVPETIKVAFPELISRMDECYKSKSRFFGFVIVPGENPVAFSAFAKDKASIGLLIHSLCDFSNDYGSHSKWIVASNDQTKKEIKKIVNAVALKIEVKQK